MTWDRFWWTRPRQLALVVGCLAVIAHQAAGWQGFRWMTLAQVGLLFATLRRHDQLQHVALRLVAVFGPAAYMEWELIHPFSRGLDVWLSTYDPVGSVVEARWVLGLWMATEVVLFLLDVLMAGWPRRRRDAPRTLRPTGAVVEFSARDDG